MAKSPDQHWQTRMRESFRTNVSEKLAPQSTRALEPKERIQQVQARMAVHLERHTPMWVGRETSKLLQENRGRLRPILSPKWIIQTEMSPAAIARDAWMRVEGRNARRLERLEAISHRMRDRVSSPDDDGRPTRRQKLRP